MSSALVTCLECGKPMKRKNLWTHLRVLHHRKEEDVSEIRTRLDMEAETGNILCPLCDKSFPTHDALALHCQENHCEDGAAGRPQDYSQICRNFTSRDEYQRWLTQICEETCTSFYKAHGEVSTGSTRERLLCNRAGTHLSTATQRAATTRKDVRFCSCHLVVAFCENGTVTVKGCLGHVGHELEPALLRFSHNQIMYLKNLLEEHSMDYIISRLRKENPTKSSKLSFVVKVDLRNIVKRFNMIPGWRHKDDVTSIRLRFEEKNPEDGIRCFHVPDDPSGKGLLLVIITPLMLEWLRKYSYKGVSLDDTFHTTRYNLRLATLMVADEKDRGLPGAFLLSGTMTTVDVQRLFLEVKSLLPNFSPAVMVTDEAPCFHNGFRAVFPNAPTRLHYCRIHIWQTWEKKTKQLVESSLRPIVNSALYRLLKEIDLDKFQRKFADILVYLRSLNQTHMADYLAKNYLGKTPTWASFASRNAIIDTTMISERFHLRIKEEFLHRNANSRIDGFVDLLIKAVEDLSENIEVKDRRRFADSAYRLRETHKRHKTAATLYSRNSEMVADQGGNKFLVKNRTCTKTFEVTFVGTCTCNPVKNTHCLNCGVCAYAWNCTCTDNRSGISCPHRHAVKMLFSNAFSGESAVMTEEAISFHPETDSEAITSAQERRDARYSKLSSIKSLYAVVQASATSLAKTDSEEAMQRLDEILRHMERAAGVAQTSSSSALAVRPELAGSGGKPQLTKVELYQRGKVRKSKKPVQDLHEELRRLGNLSQE